jgi:heptaprenylglyceryl phosphate synthase
MKLSMVNPVTGRVYTVLDSENHDWRNGIQVLGTVTFKAVCELQVVLKWYTTVDAENRAGVTLYKSGIKTG